MAEPLAPDTIQPHSVTLEIRYPYAFEWWDRMGSVVRECHKKWPTLEPVFKQNGSGFAVPEKLFRASADLEKSFVIQSLPHRSLSEFFEMSVAVLENIVSIFEIETITRIGFRYIGLQRHKSVEDTLAALAATGLIAIPSNSLFGFEPSRVIPHTEFLAASETKGMRVVIGPRVLREEDSVLVPLPLHFRPDENSQPFGVVVDYDVFTGRAVPATQIDLTEWANSAFRAVRNSLESLASATVGKV